LYDFEIHHEDAIAQNIDYLILAKAEGGIT